MITQKQIEEQADDYSGMEWKDRNDALRELCYKDFIVGAEWAIQQLEPKWINVKDRLPEKTGHYLVKWSDCIGVYISYFYTDLAGNGTSHKFTDENVSHWMFLPEPPKED